MLTLSLRKSTDQFSLDIECQLPSTGVTAIFGRSGAGKTTLINLISGLDKPDIGEIMFRDQVLVNTQNKTFLPANKRNIGYVFQESRLFPHMRVASNLQYGISPSMKPRFHELVQLLGIDHLLKRYPATLSGGEKQRVAIGRALLSAPQLLLLDEPFAALDIPRKREIILWLDKLARHFQLPMLYVSHSLDEILQIADHILVLEQGKKLVSGPLMEVWHSDTLHPWFTARDRSALLTGHVVAQHEKYSMSAISVDESIFWLPRVEYPLNHSLRLKIYASDISLSLQRPQQISTRNIFSVVVQQIWHEEKWANVQLRLGKQLLIAQITAWACDELDINVGQRLYALIKSVSLIE